MKSKAKTSKNVKIKKKQFYIIKSDLKKREKKTIYKKWQLKICEWINVEANDSYLHLFMIKYRSNVTMINKDDIIINSQGVVFTVLKTSKKMAMIVTAKPSIGVPRVVGTMAVIENTRK